MPSFVFSETPNGVYMNWRSFYPRRCRGLLAESPTGFFIVPRQISHICRRLLSIPHRIINHICRRQLSIPPRKINHARAAGVNH